MSAGLTKLGKDSNDYNKNKVGDYSEARIKSVGFTFSMDYNLTK